MRAIHESVPIAPVRGALSHRDHGRIDMLAYTHTWLRGLGVEAGDGGVVGVVGVAVHLVVQRRLVDGAVHHAGLVAQTLQARQAGRHALRVVQEGARGEGQALG